MIQSSFEAQCESAGADPAAVLSAHLGAGADPEAFWASVAEHLQAGKVRMVFVADVIPPELQRIIEFLNEHMAAIDVLGVEVRQYVGPGRRTLVPRIIGLTGAAQQAKATSPRPRYPELLADAPDAVRNLERRLLTWADSQGLTTRLSAAARQFLTADGRGVLQLYPGYAVIEIPLEPLRQRGDSEAVEAILERLSGMASKKLARKYPNVPCDGLVDAWDDRAQALLNDWLDLVRAGDAPGIPFAYGG